MEKDTATKDAPAENTKPKYQEKQNPEEKKSNGSKPPRKEKAKKNDESKPTPIYLNSITLEDYQTHD